MTYFERDLQDEGCAGQVLDRAAVGIYLIDIPASRFSAIECFVSCVPTLRLSPSLTEESPPRYDTSEALRKDSLRWLQYVRVYFV